MSLRKARVWRRFDFDPSRADTVPGNNGLSEKPKQNPGKSSRQLELPKGMGVFYFSIKKMVSERSEFIFI